MSFVGKWFGFGRNPHYDDGVRAYERHEYDHSVELFKVCIASDPDVATRDRARNYLAGSLGKMAEAAIDRGEFALARQYLAEAVHARPAFADLRRQLAFAYCLDGMYEQSSEELTHSLKINPKYGQALALRAALEVKLGDPRRAAEIAKEACSEDARLIKSTLVQVETLLLNGDNELAFEALRDWKVDPEDRFEVDVADADRAMKKRQWETAEQKYRELIDRRPRYPDLRVKHGQALLELGELLSATNEFSEAIALNSKFSEAYSLLGIALRRQGLEEDAKNAFRQALSVNPNNEIASAELMRLRA